MIGYKERWRRLETWNEKHTLEPSRKCNFAKYNGTWSGHWSCSFSNRSNLSCL